MSSFNCPTCATPIIDSPHGYITGCAHYPLRLERELPKHFTWVRGLPNGMREDDYENVDS